MVDDRDADLKRDRQRFAEFAPNPGVEGQKQTPRLTGDSRAEIPANVGLRIEREEPALREGEVDLRRKLRDLKLAL